MRDKEHAGCRNSVSEARGKKAGLQSGNHNTPGSKAGDPRSAGGNKAGSKVHSAFMSPHYDLPWTPPPPLILAPLTSRFKDIVKSFHKSFSMKLHWVT